MITKIERLAEDCASQTKLSVLNEARSTLPGPQYLHQLIASSDPDTIAIDCLSAENTRQHISYQQLHRYVHTLASVLRKHVVGHGRQQTIIPVVMPQCPELYIAYLAILEAGAGFCPILPDVPAERLKFVVEDVQAVVVLSNAEHQPQLQNVLSTTTVLQVSLKQLQAQTKSQTNGALAIEHDAGASPQDIAYIMYTSGSTGLPKGVKIPHLSVTQSLLAHDEHIPPFKRFLQFASPTFDVSVFEIFFPLFRGATLVCCERERMLADLPGTINQLRVDAAELTPTVAGTLLRTRAAAPSLRILLTIGEMLSAHVVEEFGGSNSRNSMLYAMYGPTEAAIHCTLAPRLAATSSVKNIGIPLSTVTAFIVSEAASKGQAKILPLGETGELAIAGQLADGYLNRPEQTTAAFIDMPGYGPVYRTGDRAVILEDNTIQILGRISAGQVKLRGQRVELGEIEETVCKTPNVELAVASVIDDNLVVFCSGSQGVEVNAIQTTCKAWLPRYMRPNDIAVLKDGFPRLPSGKIDRRKLADDYAARQKVDGSENQDWDEVEQKVASIVGAEIQSTITSQTSLWASGLDSLRSIKVAAALRPFFPQITVAMLLQSETIIDVASQVKATADPKPQSSLDEPFLDSSTMLQIEEDIQAEFGSESQSMQLEAVLPCHPIQIAMLTETVSNTGLNFNTIAVHCSTTIHEADVRRALEQVASQNRILRSGFMQTRFSRLPFVQLVWDHLELDNEVSIRHPLAFEMDTDSQRAVFKIHHALYDGWSWDLILSDINRILSGSQIPTRPQFEDFSNFERHQKAINYDRDKEYWQRALEGAAPCRMPNLSPMRITEQLRYSCRRTLTTKAFDWEKFAQSSRLSKQTILQTAVLLVLSVYCDTTDVISGVVSSGRERPFSRVDEVIGPCLSTYPMRVDMAQVETVSDLLHYVQRLNTGQLEHGSLSLGDIKQAAHISTNQRLFDTLCVWQQGLEDVDGHHKLIKTGDTFDALDYSFVLEGGPEDDEIWLKLTCEEEKLPRAQAELLLNQLDQLVSVITSSTKSTLTHIWSQLDNQYLSISNTDLKPLDGPYDLAATVRKVATEDPNRVAVEFVDFFDASTSKTEITTVTYRSLYDSSMAAAQQLTSLYDARPDDLVCIMLEKSPDLYITILSVILAGAGYMCIDPKTPDQRVAQITHEARCKVFITDHLDRVRGMIEEETALIECVELLKKTPDPRLEPQVDVQGDALAYAVFTSGSTGTPKGVLITRRNLASNINHLSQVYPYDPGDKLLQSCSQAFDVSVFEIFWTWHVGLTICSARNDILYRDIEAFIRRLKISHLSMTPSVAALVDPTNVPGVKFLVTAGEPMNSKVFDSWAARGLYQGYGPSETTNICNVRPRVSKSDLINNVGPAFNNTSIFVCSKQPRTDHKYVADSTKSVEPIFMPLPRGAAGEIWVGGDQVGRGYIDPMLTAQSWITHQSYGRLYRSGDMGRLLADDSLVILGREDDQVKLRGLRIELGEVNSNLVRYPNVKDAATLVVDRDNRAQLMSFFVLQSIKDRTLEAHNIKDIFSWLEKHLPDYMVPDTIIPVESIPLTRQGKIDSRKLRSLSGELDSSQFLQYSRGSEHLSDDTPLSEVERQIAIALSEHTGTPVAQITRHTSFYSLGIDSIKSISLVQYLRQNSFNHIDVSTVLKNPTIGRLVPYLQGATSEMTGSSDYTFPESFSKTWKTSIIAKYEQCGFEIARIMPCTPLQEVMLSTAVTDSSQSYRNHMKWKVHCGIDVLKTAWVAMVQRHELLRTAFVATDDTERPYAQVVLKAFELPWSVDMHQGLKEKAGHNLALPLYSFHVGHDEDRAEAYLSLNIHHAIYDAEAMAILLQEVEQFVQRKRLSPAPLFASYINYMISMDVEKTAEHWKMVLHGIKPSRINDLIPVTENLLDSATMRTDISISKLTFHDLENGAKENSTTVLALVQAALSRLVSLYTGSNDVCFGNVISGRSLSIPDVQQIVGPCFNTLPVRTKVDKRTSIRELTNSLHQQTLETLPFQPSSLRRIQRQNSPDGKALFDILLLLQQGPSNLDERIWSLEEDSGDMSFPFIIEVVPSQSRNTVELRLHYQSCDAHTAADILAHFDLLLEHTVKYSQATAINFDMIGGTLPVMREKLVTQQDQNQHDSTRDLTSTEREVCSIMKTLSAQCPSAIAPATTIFKFGLDSISAIQLASRLREQGYHIKATDILDGPSIEDIATCCETHANEPSVRSDSEILQRFDRKFRTQTLQQLSSQKQAIEDILPCTPSQSGILSQFVGSQGALYYNRMRLTIKENISLVRLKEAWQEAIGTHLMLRTGFVQLDNAGYPYAMIIYKAHSFHVPWQDDTEDGVDAADRGMRKLKDLALPPWELVVRDSGPHIILDLWMLHALYDAKSIQQILADVAAIYKHESVTPRCSIRTVLSNILANTRDTHEAQKFWTAARNDLQATKFPDMSICRQPPARLVSSTATSRFSMSEIRTSCSRLDVSFQTVCQATWSRILAAYCGQSRVTFGVILSGRMFENSQLNEAIFPCINTVPFAIETLQSDREFVASVSGRNAGLTKFQHTPLTTIKRWNGITLDLFDTVLVLQKFEGATDHSDIWSITEDEASGEYTVSFEILPMESDCDFQLTYRPDLVPEDQAQVLMQEFDDILASLLEMEKTPSGSANLSVVPAKDQTIPTNITFLHEFVEVTAQGQPDTVALEFVSDIDGDHIDKQSWTYLELDHRGNQIANALVQKGVQVGDLVAVCFDKCPEASFAILGVLKAGCGYVAIDPRAPDERRDFIVHDAQCKFVLTTSDKVELFASNKIELILADDQQHLKHVPSTQPNLKGQLTPEHNSYCLYTSGTTGTPKGCLISHASAVQAMLSFSRIFEGRWTKMSKWLQFASFHFDVSVLEQYWSWSVGICMTSAPRDLLFQDLPGNINILGITHLDLTPSLAKLLTPETVPSLCDGVFIVGGEQAQQEILDVWGGTGCLYNFYGPSEVTIGCTVHPQVLQTTKPTNIGKQWDNVGSFVLEPQSQQPVIRGAVGELCLSGPLVGKGYLNREELTNEKFVILTDFDTRVYRTGDLVRLLHDDSFEFLGRIDGQVKLRGQRLEVGEINHVILHTSNRIKEVSTIVRKHPQQDKEHLVAFYSTSSSRQPGQVLPRVIDDEGITSLSDNIRKGCSSKLPEYMVPTFFIGVDFMPLSANNKIDVKVLATVYDEAGNIDSRGQTNSDVGDSDVFPANMHRIADVLTTYLDVDRSAIQPESRLFELGLDSISVIGLSRVLKREGFKNADVPTLMNNTIFLSLCRAIEKKGASDEISGSSKTVNSEVASFADNHRGSAAEILAVDIEDVEAVLPSTPLQQGMISKVLGHSAQHVPYFAFFTYKLHETTSVQKLQQAWTATTRRLGILRTRFVSTEDGYAQVVLKKPKLSALHLTGDLGSHDIELAFHEWIEAARTFGESLPWQLCFLETGSHTMMTIFLFHGLYDGISLHLLLEAVKEEYNQQESPSDSQFVQFHDVVPYGPLRREQGAKEFWNQELLQVNYLDIETVSSGGQETIKLFDTVHETEIGSLSNSLNVTTPALFHAMWLYTLFMRFQVNPTLGLVLSGRAIEVEGAETVIGPMFNTIPCSISKLPAKSTMHDLARACHDFNMKAIPYQHSSIRDISKWLGRNSKEGLFDSLFVFQKTDSNSTGTENLWIQEDSAGSPDYALNLEIEQIGYEGNFNITLLAIESDKLSRDAILSLFDSLKDNIASFAEGENVILPENFLTNVSSKAEQGKRKRSPTGNHADTPDTNWTYTTASIRDELVELSQADAETIGLDAPSIFELGLDSIDALKLAARLKKRGLNIVVSRIMQNPTVEGIAASCQQNPQPAVVERKGKSVRAQQKAWYQALVQQGAEISESETILPVTPMQEGLLLNYSIYYHVLPYVLSEETDVQKLVDSLKRVMQTELSLRARFLSVEDVSIQEGFLQVINNDSAFDISYLNIKNAHGLGNIMQEMRQKAAEKDLLGQYPRVTIVNCGDGQTFFLLGLPHVMYDGWSLGLLHSKIAASYIGATQPQTSLKLLTAHLDEVLSQSASKNTQSFWKEMLHESTVSHYSLPFEKPGRKAVLINKPSKISRNTIVKLCKAVGVTMQSLGLACWAASLAQNTKIPDVVHGLVLSGRTTDGAESLVFPTFNTVIFRTTVEKNTSSAEFLRKIHKTSLEISKHQHFPLKDSLRLTGSSNAGSFNTLFTFQKMPTEVDQLQPLYQEFATDDATINPPYAVNIEMTEKEDQVWWTCAVQDDVATTDEVHIILEQLDQIMQHFIDHRDRHVIESSKNGEVLCGLEPVKLKRKTDVSKRPSDFGTHSMSSNEAWNDVELKIRSLLAHISQIDNEQIQKNTSIFHLGLDSISAIKVSGQLRKQGIKLSVSDAIRAQTIEKMAQVAVKLDSSNTKVSVQASSDNTKVAKQISSLLKVPTNCFESILPAASGQVYMLDAWKASQGRLFYADFWFEATRVSKQEFEKAFNSLSTTVPAFRTTFMELEDTTYAITFKAEHASKCLYPWSLESIENGDRVLARLHVHHALYDAVGLHVMVDSLTRLCRTPHMKLELNTSFAPFLEVARNMSSSAINTRKRFWTSYLSHINGRTTTNLRGQFSAKRTEKFLPRLIPFTTLRPVLKKLGVSVQTLFFAAYARIHAEILANSSKSETIPENVVLGTYLANRFLDVENIDSLVVPTFNILPVKITTSDDVSIVESAKQIQHDLQDIGRAEHCGASLRDIHEWTGLKIDGYMNFLRLPDDNEEDSDSHSSEIKVTHAEGQSLYDAQSTMRDEARAAFATGYNANHTERQRGHSPYALDNLEQTSTSDPSPESDAFSYILPAIDVEARVMPDGYLAMGIFAPSDILDADGVDQIMQKVKTLLENVIESTNSPVS